MCSSLENTIFELNFSDIEMACFSAIHACVAYCVVMARLDTSPRSEAASRGMNLFRGLFQVVNRIVTKSTRFVSGMFRVSSLVLIRVPS